MLAGLEQAIREDSGLVHAGSASARTDFLAILQRHACDLAIVGVSHPGQAGLLLLQDVLALHPALAVLALCMLPCEKSGAAAIRAGALGCLTDRASPEEILMAVRTAAQGTPYVSPATAKALISALRDPASSPEKMLSHRQMQVLRLYASGKTVTEIAGLTGLSVRTVSTYKARMLEKLQFSSNAELIAYAIGNSLVGD